LTEGSPRLFHCGSGDVMYNITLSVLTTIHTVVTEFLPNHNIFFLIFRPWKPTMVWKKKRRRRRLRVRYNILLWCRIVVYSYLSRIEGWDLWARPPLLGPVGGLLQPGKSLRAFLGSSSTAVVVRTFFFFMMFCVYLLLDWGVSQNWQHFNILNYRDRCTCFVVKKSPLKSTSYNIMPARIICYAFEQ